MAGLGCAMSGLRPRGRTFQQCSSSVAHRVQVWPDRRPPLWHLLLLIVMVVPLFLLPSVDATPEDAQLYPCSTARPWASRQRWNFAFSSSRTSRSGNSSSNSSSISSTVELATGTNGALQLQLPNPNLAVTCNPRSAECWNLVVGPAASALHFALVDTQLVVVSGGPPETHGLCVTDSDDLSKGFLANVYLADCSRASKNWVLSAANGTIRNANGQCLDVGSAGSAGDLGFVLDLLPAAPLPRQAFWSSKYVSWGGSVIEADDGLFHAFVAVFGGGKGLSSWERYSEIMHLTAAVPEGPFKPTTNGPKKDGIIVASEAHNPSIVRANDGTYLLFSIGHQPLLASKSLSGPWASVKFTSCNNPTPVVVPDRDEVYVYCHGGPDMEHWGSSIGMVWTPHWSSGNWTVASNNTDDIHGGGRDLIGHPVEDPFAWYSPSTNPRAKGPFHLLFHAFRMGMVNNSDSSPERKGNAYGAYANAPTPFGPWSFQESRVAYSGVLQLTDGSTLRCDRRERPHLLLSKDGVPTHLYNGICPMAEGGAAPNPRGVSYHANASNPLHCFTAVQKIKAAFDLSAQASRSVNQWLASVQ